MRPGYSSESAEILPEADSRYLRVRPQRYVPHFVLALVLLCTFDLRVERVDEYGLERLERLARGGYFQTGKQFLPSDLPRWAELLDVRTQDVAAAHHLTDRFLNQISGSPRNDPTRFVAIQVGVYRFSLGPILLFNLVVAGMVAGFFYARRRRIVAEELIAYQNNKYQRVNQRLEGKMLEGQRIIEKLNKLQDKLVESEKLASIGRLSATLAHEIRNPLSIIKSATEMIAEDTRDNPQAGAAIELVQAEIARMDSIITDLLNFARPKPPNLGRFMIKSLVRHWLPPIVEELDKRRIQLVPQLDHDGEVVIDPDQLWQVFLNIVWNARDALGGCQNPHLFVRLEDGGDEYLRLVVQDTGIGMLPEVLAQIREPFFTTKTQGSGLGIPVSVQLIEGMGGIFEVESELDVGTKVTLHLVRSKERNPSVNGGAALGQAEAPNLEGVRF
jgi:signal transduction histidine kinase